MKQLNIGFVSTRFAGIDGVSLEASKWAQVFEQAGHRIFWFAGELDRDSDACYLVPEAHFKHKANDWIVRRTIGEKAREPVVTKAIHDLRSRLKKELYRFIERFDIDLIIAENVLTIPMHVPLGLALTETIAETQIPTVAHHHDFFWERGRFTMNAVRDYIQMAFPPNLPSIAHVVINSEAQEQLALRTGLSGTVIPNVLDFNHPPQTDPVDSEQFKQSIGLTISDKIILQPTRVVKRKGIEHAIELVKELDDPRYKLVISHEAGDEGYEYVDWLSEKAQKQGVDLRFIMTKVADPIAQPSPVSAEFQYSLWDVYPHADFITFPSLYEGFGNAFLEAVYFKKPLLMNRYSTFIRDIEPLGFDLAIMDGFLSRRTVQEIREVLESPARLEAVVNLNYDIATHYFSYSLLREQINSILKQHFGNTVELLVDQPEVASFKTMDVQPLNNWQKSFRELDLREQRDLLSESASFIHSSMSLNERDGKEYRN